MAADPTILIDPKIEERFVSIRDQVTKALESTRDLAKEAPIKDAEEAGRVADAVRELSNATGDLNKGRLAASADYRATTEAINHAWKEMETPALAALAALKDRGLAFQKAEEARAAEEARQRQAKIDAEAEQAAKDAADAAKLAEEEPDNPEAQEMADEIRQEAAAAAVAPPAQPVAPPRQARGQIGRLGSRKAYRFEVSDEEAVPVRYKSVDRDLVKAKITAEAKAAKASGEPFNFAMIPGIRIYTVDVAVSR